MGNKILTVKKDTITLLMDNSVQTGKVSGKGNIYSEVELVCPECPGVRVFVKVMRPESFGVDSQSLPHKDSHFDTAAVAKAPVIRKVKEIKPEAKAPESKPLTAGEKLRAALSTNPALADALAAALA